MIFLFIALAAFIVFQIVQGKKRRRETEERQSKFVPGVEVMTNYGLYGTILTLDDEKNLATIETSPGTVLKIHRQTILKIADYDDVPAVEDEAVEPTDEAMAPAETGRVSDTVTTPAPEYGERTEPVAKKPVTDTDAPVADQPVSEQPAADKPVAKKPATDKLVVDAPDAAKTAPAKATATKPAAAQTVAAKPATVKKPAVRKPVVKQSVAQDRVAQEPVVQEPVAKDAAAKKPVRKSTKKVGE